jgi:hypothetical protein
MGCSNSSHAAQALRDAAKGHWTTYFRNVEHGRGAVNDNGRVRGCPGSCCPRSPPSRAASQPAIVSALRLLAGWISL